MVKMFTWECGGHVIERRAFGRRDRGSKTTCGSASDFLVDGTGVQKPPAAILKLGHFCSPRFTCVFWKKH